MEATWCFGVWEVTGRNIYQEKDEFDNVLYRKIEMLSTGVI